MATTIPYVTTVAISREHTFRESFEETKTLAENQGKRDLFEHAIIRDRCHSLVGFDITTNTTPIDIKIKITAIGIR
jgi:hypothetical protein